MGVLRVRSNFFERKAKRGADVGRTAHIDRLFVRFYDVFDDGKPQPAAALTARAAFIYTVKAVE